MLAQSLSPTPLELAGWIGCLFFLVAGWNQVERFFDRRTNRAAPREIQPQPLSVTKFDPPVPESLFLLRQKESETELLRLERELRSVQHERRAEVGDLQQK